MNKLWMLLLSLLGFAGCDEPQEDMYGTPYAEYTVKGRVTDAAGTPIAGIEVRRSFWGSDPSAVRTDTRGAYTFEADGNVLYMPPVLTFTDTDNAPVGKVIVDAEGSLLTGITRLTSSKVAASVVQGKQLVKDNEKTLLVCRITAKAARGKYDKDAISVWCAPVADAAKATEPYFYPNLDENGNTSATQGWYINQKGYSDEVIRRVAFSSTTGELSSFGRFRAGRNFLCVTR